MTRHQYEIGGKHYVLIELPARPKTIRSKLKEAWSLALSVFMS